MIVLHRISLKLLDPILRVTLPAKSPKENIFYHYFSWFLFLLSYSTCINITCRCTTNSYRKQRRLCHISTATTPIQHMFYNVCVIYSKGLSWKVPIAFSLFSFHRLIVICLLMKLRSQFPFNSLLFHIYLANAAWMPSTKVFCRDIIHTGIEISERGWQMT